MDFVTDHPSTRLRDHDPAGHSGRQAWTPEGARRYFLIGWLGLSLLAPTACLALRWPVHPNSSSALARQEEAASVAAVLRRARLVKVDGRLVDAMGSPVSGASVRFVRLEAWLLDDDFLAAEGERETRLREEGREPVHVAPDIECPSTRTGPDGSFHVLVNGGASTSGSGRAHLRIRTQFGTTTDVPAPRGLWTPAPPSDDPYAIRATWSLGDLRLR